MVFLLNPTTCYLNVNNIALKKTTEAIYEEVNKASRNSDSAVLFIIALNLLSVAETLLRKPYFLNKSYLLL